MLNVDFRRHERSFLVSNPFLLNGFWAAFSEEMTQLESGVLVPKATTPIVVELNRLMLHLYEPVEKPDLEIFQGHLPHLLRPDVTIDIDGDSIHIVRKPD